MGKREVPEDGWSEEGSKWLDDLSIEEIVDLKMLIDYGVESEEDQQKLDAFRSSYEQATGETWK